MKVLIELIQSVKQFIADPGAAFEHHSKLDIKYSVKYMLFGLLMLGLLSPLIALALQSELSTNLTDLGLSPLVMYPVFVIAIILGGLLGTFLLSAWIHLFAYLFGAKEGFNQTLKTVAYGRTPDYLFGWIPIISFLASIWSIVLIGLGLIKTQKLPAERAVAVIFISVIIPAILFAILFYALLSSGLNSGELTAY